MHPLDNPIWSALTTKHAHYALGDDNAKRYPREVTTMGAFADLSNISADAWAGLAKLLQSRETIAVLFKEPPDASAGFEIVARVEIVQMVHDGKTLAASKPEIRTIQLGSAESAEIVELGKLTNPGPIGTRSHEIGNFIGIRSDDGQLVAMAGERFCFPGYAEISGVCTRPGFEGRGSAAELVARVMDRIRARGDVPFLHSRAENERAVKLYERLGFAKARSFPMSVLRKL